MFIPQQWEQQARGELDHPLVGQLRQKVAENDPWGLRRAFEDAVAPLMAALQRGEDPRAAGLQPPPAYAWKLHFAALSATACHAHHMSDWLEAMVKLGQEPQAACYVMALRQMAKQGIGSPAYTTIMRMKDQGVKPTLRCYTHAIESCLRCPTPELTYARRLFEEVGEKGLAHHPSQKAVLGKLLMHGAREFARYWRFDSALSLLDQLEALGLRVPAFIVGDLMYVATLVSHVPTLLACVRRLQDATSTFQAVPGQSDPVTRPFKVEEGLLLGVLEVAANRGHIELAEAAWKLLKRSVALPNTPGGNLAAIVARQRQEQSQQGGEGEEAQSAEETLESDVEEDDSGASGAAAAAAADPAQLEQLSQALEASEVAEADAADLDAPRERGQRSGPPDHRMLQAEAEALSNSSRGVRQPSLVAYQALVHAYARAGQLEGMFGAIQELQEAYPGRPEVVSYYANMTAAVDALAASPDKCDEGFYLLEGWAREGRAVTAEQLNLVIAACSQMGDLTRAFETFDAYENLGIKPAVDTFNALMQGCIEQGDVETALRVFDQMQEAEVEANAHTHHQLVNAGVVMGDVRYMMSALEAMEAAGHKPRLALLERCVARGERAGDREVVKTLLRRLFQNDYRIVGIDAKYRRWMPEGGMQMLTGSSKWFSREEVLREMRKEAAINSRIARRMEYQGQQLDGRQQRHLAAEQANP